MVEDAKIIMKKYRVLQASRQQNAQKLGEKLKSKPINFNELSQLALVADAKIRQEERAFSKILEK